jgi:hypothetical protein
VQKLNLLFRPISDKYQARIVAIALLRFFMKFIRFLNSFGEIRAYFGLEFIVILNEKERIVRQQ